MLRGYFITQGLYVAVRLGLPDLLAAGDRSCDDLAAKSGVSADALYRLMRALAGEGVFFELGERRFRLAEMGAMLRTDAAGGMRDSTLIAGDAQYKVWSIFREAVKSGTPGFDRIFRQPLFEFLEGHQEIHETFDGSMARISRWAREAVLEFCAFHDGETVVDVGGGTGSLLAGVLERYAGVRGILLDLPVVAERARKVFAGSALLDRLEFVGGDFRRLIPPGEVIILSSILHMLEDDAALALLRRCSASLRSQGRIIIVEQVLGEPNARDPSKWNDLNMLVMTGGRERTFAEYADLLKKAEFDEPHLSGASEALGGYQVVEGTLSRQVEMPAPS
jgi:hypothetical protein